jgi:hypothetical protein
MASYRVNTNTNSITKTAQDKTTKETTKTKKMNHFRLSTLKQEFVKISVSSCTAFAVETHLAERQWLEKQANMLKLRKFQAGT